MVKVYDMTSGELLSDATPTAGHTLRHDAAHEWSAPRTEPSHGARLTPDHRDVPEPALQLIEIR